MFCVWCVQKTGSGLVGRFAAAMLEDVASILASSRRKRGN